LYTSTEEAVNDCEGDETRHGMHGCPGEEHNSSAENDGGVGINGAKEMVGEEGWDHAPRDAETV
jgi:hypothetical protein